MYKDLQAVGNFTDLAGATLGNFRSALAHCGYLIVATIVITYMDSELHISTHTTGRKSRLEAAQVKEFRQTGR
jgi:hypothetical protein